MKNGFTIIESLVSVAITAIVATMLVWAFGSFREASGLSEAHSTILGILEDARARTLAAELNSAHGVHFQTDRAVLFRGNAYNAVATSNESYILPTTVQISNISLGGPSDVLFSRFVGTTTASGTITIQSISSPAKTRTITILQTGVVK